MPIHFDTAELRERRDVTIRELGSRNLDGLLIFRQESMYYLTGYDTFGYVYFQCLYLGSDGRMTLVTRTPDKYLAGFTSVIDDVRVWTDGADAVPSRILRDVLDEYGCQNKRLGVEYDAYGLTGVNLIELQTTLDGFAVLSDASDLVSRQRVVKSDAELTYVRRAAELADDVLDVCKELATAKAFEGDLLAAMQASVFAGGGDYPANNFVIGSGPGALMGRYVTGRRYLGDNDQLTVEFAGVYRHYHACLMRTIRIGAVPKLQIELHDVALEAMQACVDTLRPGRTMGDVFDAYARVCDGAGFGSNRLSACGYSLGATFAPNWMDWPMFYARNRVLIEPNMVFFLQSVLLDDAAGLAVTPAHTVLTTSKGCESLSRHSLDFIVNR